MLFARDTQVCSVSVASHGTRAKEKFPHIAVWWVIEPDFVRWVLCGNFRLPQIRGMLTVFRHELPICNMQVQDYPNHH